MSYEEDPEVHADYLSRTYPNRDGLSDKAFEQAIKQAATVDIVGTVPCRGRCGGVVEWTAEAEEQFAAFNRELLSRREAPIDKTRIVFCVPCRVRGRKEAAVANREHINRLAEVIRAIKNSANPDRETELIAKAKKLHHPDVEGLLEALRAKKASGSMGKVRKGGGL